MSADIALQAFIEQHVAVVAPLSRELGMADWEMQTTSSPEATERVAELRERLITLYANKEEYAFLQSLNGHKFDDPLLARQHLLLRHSYLSNQIAPEVIAEMIQLEVGIEETFNMFRATVGGEQVSDNTLDDLLLMSDDVVQRREAWEASQAVGAAVSERVLQLVRLRNREAQRLGFPDYYVMSLELQELNPERLFALLDDLQTRSQSLWENYKAELDTQLAARFHTTPADLRPWHYHNRFFQEPGPGEADLDRFFGDKDLEKLTSEFFAAIGLPVDDLLKIADLHERPGKCQHAFCTHIDRAGDIRVLCNNRPNERWMSTTLHEFGHAVYDKFLDPALPYLLRDPAHIMTTEAIALFMGRLTKDADWLATYAGVAPEEAARIAASARREVRDHLLVFMRWCFVMAHFERALYQDPEQDLNTLWWTLKAKYQNLTPPENRHAPDWAAKIHLASAPVYYHNYQLGEMVASQLLHHLTTQVLVGEPSAALVTSPKVGAYMEAALFRPGAVAPWEVWLEHATGEPLNPGYFVEQLQTL
ncbi:MAG: Oligoendopeptidase [Chthonomonadaceae bacterium]|nr:Oligoendopeptidase [Chthonomonadaceae bacterium]